MIKFCGVCGAEQKPQTDQNGTPRVVMGDGEGFTTLILTDAESRLIRNALDLSGSPRPARAFNAGIQRATDRIAAEFAQEQKARKALKPDAATTVQKGKP